MAVLLDTLRSARLGSNNASAAELCCCTLPYLYFPRIDQMLQCSGAAAVVDLRKHNTSFAFKIRGKRPDFRTRDALTS